MSRICCSGAALNLEQARREPDRAQALIHDVESASSAAGRVRRRPVPPPSAQRDLGEVDRLARAETEGASSTDIICRILTLAAAGAFAVTPIMQLTSCHRSPDAQPSANAGTGRET